MSFAPLKVALLWHMHQPCYKDPRTNVYRLPWVRLHTVKDYYDMAARLSSFPGIKANFNLVPSLIEQIRDYASGTVNEVQLTLAAKNPDDLTLQEKLALIKDSFLGNADKMIEPHARYRALLRKCPDLESGYKTQAAIKKCSRQEFLDLQVWSNLAWVDPYLRDDPLISDLFSKGRQFTEGMKAGLLDKQMQIMREVLPKYKELADSGSIEISYSPFFHPILPLLCDSDIARVSVPDAPLPQNRIRFPEDARRQLELGAQLHKDVFGRVPAGMWPPEGGVSDEVLRLAGGLGVRWAATDEGILEASLGLSVRDRATSKVTRPDLLYRPHRFAYDGGEVAVFFRDRVLSDLIGFEYRTWSADEAVADFMRRLEEIHQELGEAAAASVVLVALDGENCWEFYDEDGDGFLRRLYAELSSRPNIQTVRLSDVAEASDARPVLSGIHPGSWIGSDFAIWIGSPEDNAAWDMLHEARTQLKANEDNINSTELAAAWRSVYAAEGSDWFWWYSSDHESRHSPEYDALFRSHIRRIYEACGVRGPGQVLRPIDSRQKGPAFVLEPAAIIRPVLDGRVTTFYEWRLAGLYESYRDVSRHTPVATVISSIYFGFDQDNLYLRIDTGISPQAPEFTEMAFRVEFGSPTEQNITIRAAEPRSPGHISLLIQPAGVAPGVRAVALEAVELAIPFSVIQAAPGQKFSFRISVLRDGEVVERRPFHDVISLSVPTQDFEAEMWSTL
jgi:alpha-amylase/alpha-mannosidase (GH57 family)